MVSIEIHYRSSGSRKDPRGSLFVRIIACRRPVSLTLPYRLYQQEWDAVNHSILIESASACRREYVREVALALEKDRRLLRELKEEIHQEDEATSRLLIERFRGRRFKSGVKAMVESLSEELRLEGRERTARAYQSSLSALLCHTGKQDLSVEEITYSRLQRFQGWLLEGGRSLNTVSFLHAKPKSLLQQIRQTGLDHSPRKRAL